MHTQSLSVTYDVSHNERESLIGPDYEEFVRTIVYPSVIKQCGPIRLSKLGVSFYKKGEDRSWDGMMFKISNGGRTVVKTSYSASEDAENSMTLGQIAALMPDNNDASRKTGRTKEAQLTKIKKQKDKISAWGSVCSGPFCNLKGGAYLHAIYENDVTAIKRMDALVNVSMRDMTKKIMGNNEMANLLQKFREKAVPDVKISLLPILADNYFYSYQYFALKCPKGLVRKKFRWTNDTYDTYMGNIYTGQAGGEQISASYVLRPEFIPLCNKVCNHLGGEGGRQMLKKINHRPSLMTLHGLDDIRDKYSCSDVAVRQFERNLLSLTQSYLDNKLTWISIKLD
jgi:hypothetical protein